MNCIFISTMTGVPWGGSEELWSQTALYLAQSGHQVGANVKAWPEIPSRISELEQAGVSLLQRNESPPTLAARVFSKLTGKSAERKLTGAAAGWLRKQKPDLVCISMGNARQGLPWLGLCRELRLPHVIVVHGVYEVSWPMDTEGAEMEDYFLAAKQCYFVSQHNLKLFQDQIATRLPHAEVVRNPYNVSYESELEWPATNDGWRLASVGRLEPPTKGQDILLKVIGSEKWKQRALAISFYGGGEQYGECVRKLAQRYAPGQVEFFGHVDDVEEIWKFNHGLVMPSRCEGMPLALVEAMLCSRLPIVTDIGGHSELVTHGVNGFLAAGPTVACIDAALEEAWQCRDAWQEMGGVAAISVRKKVPAHPAAEFARQLEHLA